MALFKPKGLGGPKVSGWAGAHAALAPAGNRAWARPANAETTKRF